MASKKKTAAKSAQRRSSVPKSSAARGSRPPQSASPEVELGGPPELKDKCNPPNICRYLKELDAWLRTKFIPDYTALRIAVCNVEKQAFSNAGVNAKPPKFCTGGPVVEPPPPPPPPVF